MQGLTLEDIREEIVSLLNESAEELRNGYPQTAISILVEAQFLLSDAIQNEMNRAECTPLVPLGDERSETSYVRVPGAIS
jgi:hypothetical protein